jgi:hypothetical protein
MTVRYIEFVRAGWGASLLAAPRAVLTGVPGARVDRKALVIIGALRGGRGLMAQAKRVRAA